jgi:TPR repeat protein
MTTLGTRKSSHTPPPPVLGFLAVVLIGMLVGFVIQQWRWGGPITFDSIAISKPTLQHAETAFRQGRDQAAVKQFTELADQNDPLAQYWLGHATELGVGVPRDPAKAIELYKKAAARDIVGAQVRLGEIYMHGDLAPPDFALAKSYLEKAAYHGDPRAAILLGQMHRLGLGTGVDLRKAYAWSEVSALEGGTFAKRERDASLHGLDTHDQKAAIARAKSILAEIKRETSLSKAPKSKQG